VKAKILLLIGLALCGCNDNNETPNACEDKIDIKVDLCEEEIAVSKDQCIIKEAIVQFLNGNQREKFVYFHDGTNYYKIDSYTLQNDGSFTNEPGTTTTFTYDDGRIVQVIVSFNTTPDSYLKTIYSYGYPEVKIESSYITHGAVGTVYEYNQFYIPDSKDSIYQHVEFLNGTNLSYLSEMKGGNRTRLGTSDDKSACFLYGSTWKFNSKTYYDDQPNVLKEYAICYPFNGTNGLPSFSEQFWVQTNANNMIGNVFDDGSSFNRQQYCWTFLRSSLNKLFLKKVRMEGTIITYTYDCE